MNDEPTCPNPNWQTMLFNWLLPEEERLRFTMKGVLWALAEAIDDHEREIIEQRIGRWGPPLSQLHIALGLGLSRREVMDLESSAKRKMREAIEKDPFSWV